MSLHKVKSYSVHIGLFLLTLITTTLAGAEWRFGQGFLFSDTMGWSQFWQGLYFSVPFLSILTAHEFGHYFTARLYQVRVTLPYYIPLWFGQGFFGTMGAFIRIKSPLHTLREYFDIGIAGPLAGYVIAIGVIWFGFTHLPPPDYIFSVHPEYAQYGPEYAEHVYTGEEVRGSIALGQNLTFWFFENFVVDDPARMPNRYEIIHYPFLLAGYLALLFTSLNLIPIGQLDGGHILFSLIGFRRYNRLAPLLFIGFVFYAGLGLIKPTEPMDDLMWEIPLYLGFLFILFSRTTTGFTNTLLLSLSVFALQFLLSFLFPAFEGYSGWLAFSFVLGRFLGVYHPPVMYEQPLSGGRKLLGWLTLIIFIISFSPEPFVFVE